MENSTNSITAVAANEGKILSVVGDTYRIVITGEQTGGAYAAIDMLIPPGGGPPPHSHPGFQESFYVLDGEIEVKTESQAYTAKKGSFVNIPLGGMVHCFKNKTDAVTHLLCMVVPSGLEQMFLEIGQPVEAGTFLPPPHFSPEDLGRMVAIAEKYGQKLFPPDYLDK